jgi:hypothetical protein
VTATAKSITKLAGMTLVIQGEYQLTASSQVVAEPLLLLHFILSSIDPKGSPARISAELLSGFLPEESFVYKELIFDLSTDELVTKYVNEVSTITRNLEK